MGIMGVPVKSKGCLYPECAMGECWKDEPMESMLEAGREEKWLAEWAGSYCEN